MGDDGFLTTGNEAFIDTDWLTDNKVASVQERNCEVCKHRKQYKNVDTGRVIRGCDSWECNFERR